MRAYGQRVEELGFTHLLAYDHVVGADPDVHTGWDGPYDVHTTFHEPLVMFGYLAAVTTSLELVTGVIILPQRQTALVAKQAAEVDLLSEGRLRLGVGIGWNAVEYEALGEDFSNRGKRLAEQVELLRRLWTEQTRDVRRHVPPGDRRRAGAAARAAADPGVDRCQVAAGAGAGGQAGRRLVPDDGAGTGTRRSTRDRRALGDRGGQGSRHDRHGRPRDLER